jgi:fructokinase
MTAPILVAGEALFDLVAGASGELAGHPGGGPFNVARTIGRLRRPVAYLGRLSTDRLGAEHERLLAADGVGLGCVVRTADPTTLALASLAGDGAASYAFYTADTAAAGLDVAAALAVLPAHVAALHAGTLGLVLEPLAAAVEAVVRRLAGTTLVAVDLNIRPQAIADESVFRARVARVLGMADLVQVSEDDVGWLQPGRRPAAAARALLDHGPRAVVLTRGARGATVIGAGGETDIAAVRARVTDTIGAGDAFGGALLAWWISHDLGRADLARGELLAGAARFAAAVAARTVAAAGASPPWLPAAAAGRPLAVSSL